MNFITITYTLSLCASLLYCIRFSHVKIKIIACLFCILLSNLPILWNLSLITWLDSIFATPSLFLLFLSLSVCFQAFYAPYKNILSLQAKFFIACFGLILFLGNLNVLGDFDLFTLSFSLQLIILFFILSFAFFLDSTLGIFYLSCLFIFAFSPTWNPFFSLIDSIVWLYALVWICIEGIQKIQQIFTG